MFLIFEGNAKYGSPSIIMTIPITLKKNFIFKICPYLKSILNNFLKPHTKIQHYIINSGRSFNQDFSTLNPILLFFGGGSGFISSLIACSMASICWSCPTICCSSWVILLDSSLCSEIKLRSFTKALTMNTLTSIARVECKTLAAIIVPCSLKTYGKAVEILAYPGGRNLRLPQIFPLKLIET